MAVVARVPEAGAGAGNGPLAGAPIAGDQGRTAPSTIWSKVLLAAAVVILATGLVLRFATVSHLWLDEALTVNIARLPLARIPAALRHDGAPPLYYFVLHGWTRVFGGSDVAVRTLSGLFAVLALPFMWFAGRRIGPPEDRNLTAGVAVLLLASSPFAIHFATEARMYSLVVLLSVLAYLALVRALQTDRPGWRELVPLAVVCALLLYTHYWSLYLLATVAAVLLGKIIRGTESERIRSRRCLAALVVGFVLFLPWVPSFLYQLRHTGTPWAEPASFSAMVNAISEFGGGRSSSGRALGLTFFALAGLGLFGAAIDRVHIEIDLHSRPPARGLAVAVAGTLALAITVGLATHGAFAARYTAVVFAPFLLLVTLGTTVLLDHRLLALVVAAAVLFGFITTSGIVVTERTQAAQLAATIRQQVRPGDVVGYCPDQLGPSTSRLLPGGINQITFPHRTPPYLVDWVDYAQNAAAGDPVAFADLLDRAAGPHTVWLVWDSQYRTLGTKCETINAGLTALRPKTAELRAPDLTRFFEHAYLFRYLPR